MKKIIVAIICVILATFMLVGCGDSTDKLSNVGGEVYSGNGSFAVEKGDYVYFINGQKAVTAENKFGEVEKGSLIRVKKSDLANPSGATIETVIPKLMLSASYKTGVFVYGDYVYYATPNDEKDKQSNILNNQTVFNRFNLNTGKVDVKEIAIAEDNTTEYRFIKNGDSVYLTFVKTTTENDKEVKKLVVYNADNKKLVYESFGFEEMLMPEDNSAVVFLTKFDYDEINKTNTLYQHVYKYTVGDSKESNEPFKNGSPEKLGLLQGATFSLVKNDGKYLIYKQNSLDTTNNNVKYFAYEISSNTETMLGYSNVYIDSAITANSYIKSLNEIYYMDTTTEVGGLVKFDYACKDMSNGRTPINKDVKDYTMQFVEGDYFYFSNADGMYFRCKFDGSDYMQINAIAMKTATDWYKPRVIGNYFIGIYAGEMYYSYVYVIDMSKVNDEYIEKYSEDKKEIVEELANTKIAKMTQEDKDAFNKAFESKYNKD